MREDQCAFCKSDVPLDATVCAHCGAYKGRQHEAGGFGVWPAIILIIAGVGAVDVWRTQPNANWAAVVYGILFVVIGLAWCYYGIKSGLKRTWLR